MRVSGSPLSTQITYIRALRDLMVNCGDVPENLSVERIKTYLSSLRTHLSSSALNLRVCGIKYYFRHVVKRLDLVVDIPNPRVAKYVQEVLSEADLAVLFAACTSMRELAMLHLLYDCGLRSREVCYLKLSDFDKIHRKLTIRNSKGNTMRTLPYSESLRTTLIQYFQTQKTPPSVFLFENKETAGKGIAPETLYALLFDSAWQTLNQFGWDKRWLGAQIGATMILHTWGQNLSLHPHLHCIVPSGGLGKDGKWQHPKKGNEKFLFPVNAMKSVFKAIFLRELNKKIVAKSVALPPMFSLEKADYKAWKNALYEKEWVIYAKRPFGGPQAVIEYLGRYTHYLSRKPSGRWQSRTIAYN